MARDDLLCGRASPKCGAPRPGQAQPTADGPAGPSPNSGVGARPPAALEFATACHAAAAGRGLWLHMTLPLMFGFTLPFLDQYFAGYYASNVAGDITRLANAKQIFSAPMSMLAQAAGVASLPFFAQLWAKGKHYEFAVGVADSVSRVVALGFVAASAMIALAQPIAGLVFGGGRFTPEDVRQTALFFALYALSLFLWSAQAIYARSFYAAGVTW